MKRLGLAYNPTSAMAVSLRERAMAWCDAHGVEGWVSEAADRATLLAQLPKTDILAVLGGDGTFLRGAWAVAHVDVPILGVNGGRVGFLSKVEPDARNK